MNLGAYPAIAVPKQLAFAAGGRLTLVQNTPVMASDQTAKTVIYYTPHQHGAFPVIKNGVIRPVYFNSDLQLTMTSAFTGSGIFDLFGIERGGKAVMVAGTAWSVATAGAGARGTTPGQTELIRVAGMNVNRWGMPGLSAENATYIEPLEGRYLGSVSVDASAGQTSCHVSYGQSRKWGLWNADNRQTLYMKGGNPSTGSWSYFTATIRAAGGDATNCVTSFTGLAECQIKATYRSSLDMNTTLNTLGGATIGLGLNSTTTFSGTSSTFNFNAVSGGFVAPGVMLGPSDLTIQPLLGISVITALEKGNGVSNTNLFLGTETSMLLTTTYSC